MPPAAEIRHSRCPVCLSARTRPIYSGRDRVVDRFIKGNPVTVTLCKCRNCGMLFLEELDYPPDIIHEAYWEMLVENIADDYAVDCGSQYVDLLDLSSYRRTNRILEIGCGDGFLLDYLRRQGWEVVGIDLSSTAQALAAGRYGLEVIKAELSEELVWELGPGSFDLIIMWGMIEHLTAPRQVLELSRRLLREGGAVVVYTPNSNSIFHRLARATFYGTGKILKTAMERVVIAMHTLYFNPKTLSDVLRRNGYLVERMDLLDIDVDFIFRAHRHFWWSNGFFLTLARLLQKASHLLEMQSHILAVARKTE